MIFHHPYVLLLAFPLLILWALSRFRKKSTIQTSFFSYLKKKKYPGIRRKTPFVDFFRIITLILIVVALAGPVAPESEMEYNARTVDIMLAIDISGSMKAEDFQPHNRLEVAKEEAKRFIEGRKEDRMGLVVFAQKSFTQCPLTLDHEILKKLLAEVRMGLIRDGTAIGLAIANGVNRLLESEAKSKVLILLTDGENNSGQIDPLTAAELAKAKGIRVYTIGVGRGGVVPYPEDSPVFGRMYKNVRLDVDEKTLKEIAKITGGLYFRARNQEGLRRVYRTIDELEKTDITVKEYVNYRPLYQTPLLLALCFLMLEIVFRYFIYLKIP